MINASRLLSGALGENQSEGLILAKAPHPALSHAEREQKAAGWVFFSDSLPGR